MVNNIDFVDFSRKNVFYAKELQPFLVDALPRLLFIKVFTGKICLGEMHSTNKELRPLEHIECNYSEILPRGAIRYHEEEYSI